MGLAPLLSSHALWQAFHIAWVLSLLILLPLPKPKIHTPGIKAHPAAASQQALQLA